MTQAVWVYWTNALCTTQNTTLARIQTPWKPSGLFFATISHSLCLFAASLDSASSCGGESPVCSILIGISDPVDLDSTLQFRYVPVSEWEEDASSAWPCAIVSARRVTALFELFVSVDLPNLLFGASYYAPPVSVYKQYSVHLWVDLFLPRFFHWMLKIRGFFLPRKFNRHFVKVMDSGRANALNAMNVTKCIDSAAFPVCFAF